MASSRWARTAPFFFLVIGVLGVFFYRSWHVADTFPALGPGVYVGEITGLGADRREVVTLYIERLESSETFLVVAFLEGMKPQVVTAVPTGEASAGGSRPFEPLPLALGDRELRLIGKQSSERVTGSLLSGQERIGEWSARKLSREELSRYAVLSEQPPFPLEQWLVSKAIYKSLKQQLGEVEKRLADRQEKKVKLSKFLGQEELLRKRAEERRVALAEELKNVVEKRKASAKQINDLVNELALQSRISVTGRAIELARRVAKRENDWYNANWGASEDVADFDRVFSEHPDIDAQRVEAEFRRANETRTMLRDIQLEREKIRDLEERARGVQSVPAEQLPAHDDGGGDGQRESDKSTWDQLF